MAMSLVPPDWLVSRRTLVPSWPALSFALLALFFVTRPGPWLPRLLAALLALPVALLASTELILRALAASIT